MNGLDHKHLGATVQNLDRTLRSDSHIPASHTLTCWKEIADYLDKGVRTVQRWERDMGLPVRRVNGTKGRVFAMCHELEVWLQSSTTWRDDRSDSELAKLRKKVTHLLLENEKLRRALEEFEARVSSEPNVIVTYPTSPGSSGDLASSRRESNRGRSQR